MLLQAAPEAIPVAEMSIEAFPARTDRSWAPASILMRDAGLEPEVHEAVDDLLAASRARSRERGARAFFERRHDAE